MVKIPQNLISKNNNLSILFNFACFVSNSELFVCCTNVDSCLGLHLCIVSLISINVNWNILSEWCVECEIICSLKNHLHSYSYSKSANIFWTLNFFDYISHWFDGKWYYLSLEYKLIQCHRFYSHFCSSKLDCTKRYILSTKLFIIHIYVGIVVSVVNFLSNNTQFFTYRFKLLN